MTQVVASGKRAQSLGAEIANSVSQGVGLLAAVVAVPVLIVDAVQRGGATGVVGASVFASTVALCPPQLLIRVHSKRFSAVGLETFWSRWGATSAESLKSGEERLRRCSTKRSS